ncbi:hypothetical protein GC207_05665 [bacterium]|nr:hypothetical protein [bacterium]
MAFKYFYEEQTSLLNIVGYGEVTMDERVRCVQRVLADPDLANCSAIIIDVNEVTNPPNVDEVPFVARLIDKLRTRFGGRVAIVNAVGGHVTASHMVALSAVGEYDHVRVFQSEIAAREWLKRQE